MLLNPSFQVIPPCYVHLNEITFELKVILPLVIQGDDGSGRQHNGIIATLSVAARCCLFINDRVIRDYMSKILPYFPLVTPIRGKSHIEPKSSV